GGDRTPRLRPAGPAHRVQEGGVRPVPGHGRAREGSGRRAAVQGPSRPGRADGAAGDGRVGGRARVPRRAARRARARAGSGRPAPSPADGERREGGPQRPVPLRLRQEVQEVLLSETGRLRNVAHRSRRTPVHDPDPHRRGHGEQSAKSLRGQRMEDLIFHGSQSRKPVGLAEVELTFRNDGTLSVPWAEVSVARRLYRTGESEYLLNNSAARLRDILDLFAGTGANPRAYSVIDQDKLNHVL